jgi:hypothetical protein
MLGLTGIFLSGCSDDESPSAKETLLNNLSGTWQVASVTVDNADVTQDYAAFELTLSGSAKSDVFAYAVTGRPELSPWPAGGTWSFGTDMKSEIVRDQGTDNLLINYSITDSQLTIGFMFSGLGYNASRIRSSEGNWVYTFAKK